jgi:hypothetical protein
MDRQLIQHHLTDLIAQLNQSKMKFSCSVCKSAFRFDLLAHCEGHKLNFCADCWSSSHPLNDEATKDHLKCPFRRLLGDLSKSERSVLAKSILLELCEYEGIKSTPRAKKAAILSEVEKRIPARVRPPAKKGKDRRVAADSDPNSDAGADSDLQSEGEGDDDV